MKKEMNRDVTTLVGTGEKISQEAGRLLLIEEKASVKQDQYEILIRDLHDTLQQTLLVLNMKLQKAKLQFPEGFDSRTVDESLEYSKLALTQMKEILSGKEESNESSLYQQLCSMVSKLSGSVDFKITFEHFLKGEFPNEKAAELIKVIDEILTNVIKYAKAQHVSIQLSENQRNFFVRVKDDGIGFDPGKVSEGRGLKNIRHRVGQLGGTIHVDSNMGKGTNIHIAITK